MRSERFLDAFLLCFLQLRNPQEFLIWWVSIISEIEFTKRHEGWTAIWMCMYTQVYWNPNFPLPRSRYTSGRTIFCPYGNTAYEFVETGNILACRCILLCIVASWRKLRWVLEHPDNTFLRELPRWQWLISTIQVWCLIGLSELVGEVGFICLKLLWGWQ